jgi:beta-glucosidase
VRTYEGEQRDRVSLKLPQKGYDTAGITPLFPFGYGLSYTSFGYSNLRVTPSTATVTTPIHVRFRLANRGSRSGAEVSQVYVGLPASAGEPPKRLVGYAKTVLAAGQTTTVDITIDPSASTRPLSYFNTTANSWEIAPGTYTVYAGPQNAQPVDRDPHDQLNTTVC